MNRYWIGIGCFCLSLLTACSLFDPEETLPVYLHFVDANVRVQTPEGVIVDQQGLRDVWLEHNGVNIGVYRLGGVIPFLPDPERNELTIRAGIFENGLSALRSAYPYLQPITIQIDNPPLDTLELDLTFDYFERDSILVFPLEETFESGGISAFSSNLTQEAPAGLNITSSNVYQGEWAGRVSITNTAYNFELVSKQLLALPRSTDNVVYLEITYQNTVPFTAGLIFDGLNGLPAEPIPTGITFLSEDKWNTVYINLSTLIQRIPANGAYQLYLSASGLNATGDISQGDIFLDNIRVIAFDPR